MAFDYINLCKLSTQKLRWTNPMVVPWFKTLGTGPMVVAPMILFKNSTQQTDDRPAVQRLKGLQVLFD